MKKIRSILFLLILIIPGTGVLGQGFSVMSFNIRYDNAGDGINKWDLRKESVIALIENHHPAILGVQEALHHQLMYMDIELESYKYVGVGRDDGKTTGEYSAILFDTTIFSVISSNTFWLSETPEEISVGWDASMERICTYGLFERKADNKRIWVFNTHFDHIGIKARERSAELILRIINEVNPADYSLILMGDLNSTSESAPIQRIKSEMQNAKAISKSVKARPKGTFNGFDHTATMENQIDYIFVTGVDVLFYQHINEKRKDGNFISDHLPVIAIVK